MEEKKEEKKEENYLDIIKRLAKEIKFGSISIVIQDGKVVQIERNEKYRIKN